MHITTDCPECGRVDLSVDDVTLVVNPLEDDAWYTFDCFGCGHRVVKPASDPVVSALTRVKVRLSIVPDEVLERRGTTGRAPLGTDDLLDALLWLRTHHDPSDAADDAVPAQPLRER